jgi:hypothetical protein
MGSVIHLGDVVFQALWTETSISVVSTCKAQHKFTVARFQAHSKSLGFVNHSSLSSVIFLCVLHGGWSWLLYFLQMLCPKNSFRSHFCPLLCYGIKICQWNLFSCDSILYGISSYYNSCGLHHCQPLIIA